MAVSTWNRHDCYFRHVMSRAADAATELRPWLSKAVAERLQWDELELVPGSFVSHELQSRCTDILYRTRYDDREGTPHATPGAGGSAPDLRYLGTLARSGGGELEAALTYILSMGDTDRTDLEPVVDQLGPEAKEALMTTAERFVAKGRAEALLELLALRFGPVSASITDRVNNSSIDQLQQWTARVLTAETLAEIFEL
ncbi:Rpn family recombination-promoting nuclease/putative transposase [Nocardia sp. CDC153]|uniref:Rpn family recombination-promoting nuclease/putative transposase n=1 Tax=Nocardia sp. CDC153 TaxID=3112167 RepID=UPI002DBDE43F|nr:Rpn family recombination-promoting nuclease/putative transposase [Nocardia sp. CDC153]MEC3956398.1 Rpn family recombination-promoting nuclease/putative transposase [Nocardia sp. CDC153]